MTALVLFRKKIDGYISLCIDYHMLNAICIKNVYSLSLRKDLTKEKLFTKLVLREAYYRVRIKEGMSGKLPLTAPLDSSNFGYSPLDYRVPLLSSSN